MTEAEVLMAAIDKLTISVETLEMLKNISMAEWLVSVLDTAPELEAVASTEVERLPQLDTARAC